MDCIKYLPEEAAVNTVPLNVDCWNYKFNQIRNHIAID